MPSKPAKSAIVPKQNSKKRKPIGKSNENSKPRNSHEVKATNQEPKSVEPVENGEAGYNVESATPVTETITVAGPVITPTRKLSALETRRVKEQDAIVKGDIEAKAGDDARALRDYEERSTSIAQQARHMRTLVRRVQELEHTRDALVKEFFHHDDDLRDLEAVKHTLNDEILMLERKIRRNDDVENGADQKPNEKDENNKFALTPKLLDDANYRNESLIDELQTDKAAWHEMRQAKVKSLDERKYAARQRRKRVHRDKQQIEAMIAERNSNDAQLRTRTRERETLQDYVQAHGSKWLDMLGSPEDFLDRLALNRHIFLLRKRIEQQRQATLSLHEEFESTGELRRLQLHRSCTTLFDLVANARLNQFTNSVSVATRGAINYVLKRALPLLQQEFVEQQISCLQDERETERRNFDVFAARLRVQHLKLTHKLWTAKVQVQAIRRRKERQQAEKIAQVMRVVEKQQHDTSSGDEGDDRQDYFHDNYQHNIDRDGGRSDQFDDNERLINDVLKRTRNDALGFDVNVLGDDDDDDDHDWIPNVHGSQDSD